MDRLVNALADERAAAGHGHLLGAAAAASVAAANEEEPPVEVDEAGD